MVVASITDPIVNWAVKVVGDLGLPGIFLLMMPESAGIPIPSEATMLFAGFNVEQGRYSLAAAVAVGTVANLVGSWILYGVGYFGRQEVLAKHGRKLHASPESLARADRWFEKWGTWAVFFSRMLPIVRTFISLPAGVARMPFWKFTAATLAGCLPWVLMLTLVGKAVGANWVDWKDRLHYVDYLVVVAIVVGIVYLVVRWWRWRPEPGGPSETEPVSDRIS
jgi:membrane protein DedA with SNARE-associated domain